LGICGAGCGVIGGVAGIGAGDTGAWAGGANGDGTGGIAPPVGWPPNGL